jgi:uncharacterized protein YjiS (DUF1127 family)
MRSQSGHASRCKRGDEGSIPSRISVFMTPQAFLHHLLTSSAICQLSKLDQDLLKDLGIESFIFSKISSKKFRKFRMDEACIARTKIAIKTQVQKDEALEVVFPQGGYKLWRMPSSPTIDWAEFFNVAYILEYLAPIAQVYQPGVKITYYLHTLLMELHDNLTTEEVTAYVNSFETLLNEFRKYLPKNVSISILRDADLYARDEYFAALEKGKTLAEKEYETLPQARKDDLARMANLNIKWQGKEDWTHLNEIKKAEKIRIAALYEMAATSQLSRVAEQVKAPNKVLLFTKATKDFIGIGSTKASIAKYWVGFGVLQKKAANYLPIVLTPSQYDLVMKQPFTKVSVDLVKLPNFDHVLLFDKPLTFSH